MSSSRRLLFIFTGIIGLLVLVTVLLVFLGGNKPVEMLAENSPAGTVQRYLMAIADGEYLEAYGYLSPRPEEKLTYENWQMSVNPPSESPAYRVTLENSRTSGDDATVEVVVEAFRNGSLFDNPVSSNHVIFILSRIEGNWKITSPTWVWLLY
jgi:hypothetical protein